MVRVVGMVAVVRVVWVVRVVEAGLTGWGGWAKKLNVTQRDKSLIKNNNFSTTRPALLVKTCTIIPSSNL